MAIYATLSNHFKKQVMDGLVDFGSHVFKMILMKSAFSFDRDTHATYLDVSGEEIPQGNGYTSKGNTLESGELTEDDTNDRGRMTWVGTTFTASGDTMGPIGSAIIFDETATDDTVIGCIDFDTAYSITANSSLHIDSVSVNLV
uniref:Uncharacterized protein n=1 Tax=viral metagenome TaxID=1070528 RepID=A0A6M3KJ61_9ZZZZ